jgi:DNA-binding response OmpR family regulator
VSEDAALEEFVGGEYDLVILDYHLSQGNGVNCLRFIRQHNPTVAVIAISGVATDEIAADLIEAGADDYLAKQTLDKKVLAQSVRNVLIRAKAYRSRFVTA